MHAKKNVQHVSFVFCRSSLSSVDLEDGISDEVKQGLEAKGHSVNGPITGTSRTSFGRGHCISRGAWFKRPENTVVEDEGDLALWAGSDPRADGMAVGY